MKITDPAHAVRVLEHLAKNGAQSALVLLPQRSWPFVYALVEGAKAVLEVRLDWQENPDLERGESNQTLMGLAQAYAPRMAEAGMEVPE